MRSWVALVWPDRDYIRMLCTTDGFTRRQTMSCRSEPRQGRPPRDPCPVARRSKRQQAESEARAIMSAATGTSNMATGAGAERREHDGQQSPAPAIPPARTGGLQARCTTLRTCQDLADSGQDWPAVDGSAETGEDKKRRRHHQVGAVPLPEHDHDYTTAASSFPGR